MHKTQTYIIIKPTRVRRRIFVCLFFQDRVRSQKARRTRPVTAIINCDRFPEPWCCAQKHPFKESISFPLFNCMFLLCHKSNTAQAVCIPIFGIKKNNLSRKALAFRYLIVCFYYAIKAILRKQFAFLYSASRKTTYQGKH